MQPTGYLPSHKPLRASVRRHSHCHLDCRVANSRKHLGLLENMRYFIGLFLIMVMPAAAIAKDPSDATVLCIT